MSCFLLPGLSPKVEKWEGKKMRLVVNNEAKIEAMVAILKKLEAKRKVVAVRDLWMIDRDIRTAEYQLRNERFKAAIRRAWAERGFEVNYDD